MSKYDPLGSYLRAQPASHVPMTFREIESVIGAPLPPVAKSARAWWSNNPSNNVMTKVWTAAGFRSEQVDMAAEKLVFRREGSPGGPPPLSPPPSRGGKPHPLFGCLKGTAAVAEGHDLAAPIEAGWGEAVQ